MRMLSYSQGNVYEFDNDDFLTYYNTHNGKIINVPKEYISYLDEYYEVNDFFGNPNKATSSMVVTICINLTTKCNLRCKYCFNDKTKYKDLDIDKAYEFIEKMIMANPNANKYFIDLSGSGEPLLFLDKILKIAAFASKMSDKYEKDVIAQFATNGLLLTKEVAKILQKNSVLFGVSLDGYKELHDLNRIDINGKPTYDQIKENIEQIEHRDYVGVAMTIDSEDVDIFKAYINLSKYFATISIRPSRREYKNFKIDKIIQGYEKFASYLIECALNNDISMIKKIINGDDFFGKMLIKVCGNSYLENRCEAGKGRFALGADGNVYPCSAYVFDEKEKTEIGKKYNIKTYYRCQFCYLNHFCGGLCPIQFENYENSDALCQIKKKLFELALKVCGTIELNNQDTYLMIINEMEQVLSRSLRDEKMYKTYLEHKDKYTYSQVKNMLDNNIEIK